MAIIWPDGLEAIKRYYGDPRSFVRDGGESVDPAWPESILTYVKLPAPLPLSWDPSTRVSRIRCHVLVASSLGQVLAEIHAAGLWGVDGLRDYGGCYSWRTTRGGTKLSTHCWGIACDFRVAGNALGEKPDMPAAIVEAFEAAGWTWGGRWARPDGMHWQAGAGY